MRYSEIACFNGCPTKYRLEYIDRLEKIEQGEDANDRNWGAAVHEGLRAHYSGGAWADVEKAFRVAYPADLNPKDQAKTLEGGLEALKGYIAFYKEQDKDWRVLSTEGKMLVENEGEHELTIDLIAEHIPSSTIYFWDHKTTGKAFSYTYWKQYELSAQITRYTEAVQQKYGSCGGCYINGIAVGHRQRMYKGEPAGYWQKFERQLFNRTPQQIEAWKRSDQDWMKIVAFNIQNNVWPKAYGYLCSFCQFHELCVSADDEQIKELLYQTKKEKVQECK